MKHLRANEGGFLERYKYHSLSSVTDGRGGSQGRIFFDGIVDDERGPSPHPTPRSLFDRLSWCTVEGGFGRRVHSDRSCHGRRSIDSGEERRRDTLVHARHILDRGIFRYDTLPAILSYHERREDSRRERGRRAPRAPPRKYFSGECSIRVRGRGTQEGVPRARREEEEGDGPAKLSSAEGDPSEKR